MLAIFMMSLVFTLSMVPCCAPAAGAIETVSSENSTDCCENESCSSEEDNTGKEDKNCDTCSPFFTCGSCSGFTFMPALSPLSHLVPPTKTTYSSFELQIHSEYFETKWQPPKIS